MRDELPPADLLLVKDVLQHLSNADISRFLAQLPYCSKKLPFLAGHREKGMEGVLEVVP